MKDRRSRRSPVLLAATIEVSGRSVQVKLRNLSEEGALIEGEPLPVEGSATFFTRNDLRLKSRIVWVQDRYAGVAFEVPLKPEQVLRNIPAPKRQTNATQFRRPGLSCRPFGNYERQMLERWMTNSPNRSRD